MFVSAKFLMLVAHFQMVGNIEQKFENRLDRNGDIIPPHFSLGLGKEVGDAYWNIEFFGGTDSIGSGTVGGGVSGGILGCNDVFCIRFGGVLGVYGNNELNWRKYNDSMTINVSKNWALVPMVGAEVVIVKELSENFNLILTNRNFFVISNLTLGVEYSF